MSGFTDLGPIATAAKHLIAAGITGDALVTALAEIECALTPPRSAAAVRQARYRERKRAAENITRYVTHNTKKEAVSPRPLSEEKTIPPSPPKGGSSPKRGTRLAENWFLPDEWRAWAVAQNFSDGEADLEAAKFRDYFHARAGPNGVKLDWFATWRNWIRNAEKYQPNPRVAKQSAHDKAFAGFARAANPRDLPGG